MSHTIQMDDLDFDWHSKTVEEVEQLQETSMMKGLSTAEAAKRLEAYGKNELPAPAKTPFYIRLWNQLNNILIFILIGAVCVCGFLQEWAEVALVCGVVVINVTIGLVQEGKAEAAADAIKGMLSANAIVVRNGEQTSIPANMVVPGDICCIKAGDQLPADLRVIEAANLRVAEDALTGESNPVAKHIRPIPGGKGIGLGDRKNCCYSATCVQGGTGKGIVIATGEKAQIGQINDMVNTAAAEKECTNLERQLEMFGRYVAAFTMIVAVVTFFIAWKVAEEDTGTAFKSAVAIAVAIIPEGLPAVVTISLALAMTLLAKNNAIVKKLPAVETLGSVTVICSDKTGTLTKNEMTVQKLQTAHGQYPVNGVGYNPELGTVCDPGTGKDLPEEHINRLLAMFEGTVLCNDATLKKTNGAQGLRYEKDAGYPTEAAMCTLGLKLGCGGSSKAPEMITQFRNKKPRKAAVPFASEHKFMCCFHQDGADIICHVKGAPDRLLPRCKDQVEGDDLRITKPLVTKFWEQKAAEMSAQGLRVLAVARSTYDVSLLNDDMNADVLLKAPAPFLTLIGLVAILDPPREEAIRACGIAKKAGIVVKMITGDHPETATAIAKQLGIVNPNLPNDQIIKIAGPDLDRMLETGGEAALDKFVMSCNVFARASPQNKIAIVKSLKRIGQTPSMTGDGVNDAPALAAADIGVAMGITGTDVSKEAAKMVLADDNFATIVRAVQEGRRVWDNLVKILLYNMPVNFAQGLSVFFSYVLRMETVPLTAIQVLYVNMITSVTMGLMLAMEPAEPSIMERPPRRNGKRLFGRMVAWHCVYVSSLIIICVLFVFQYQMDRFPITGSGCLSKGGWAGNDKFCDNWCSVDNVDDDMLDPNPCPKICWAGWKHVHADEWKAAIADGRRSYSQDLDLMGSDDIGFMGSRRAKLPPQCPRVKLARAGAFNMLVFAEIAYALNCRYLDETSFTLKQFTDNKWAIIAIAVTSALQIFLTYTPVVQDVFSNANIDAEVWGIIMGLMVLVFILIDIEKTFGPKYLMPLIRNAGFCLKTPEDDSFKAQGETTRQMWHIATSASTTGMPSSSRQGSRSVSRNASQDQIGHGLSHPVAQHRPEHILALSRDQLHRQSQFSIGGATSIV